MATDISEAHTTLRAEISTKAQDIVNRLMPEKIMVLDQFYKVYRLDPAARRKGACSSYNNDVTTSNTDRTWFAKNLVTTQQPIRDFRATVEGELSTLADKCTGIVENSANTGKKRKIGEVDGEHVSVSPVTPLVATPANQVSIVSIDE